MCQVYINDKSEDSNQNLGSLHQCALSLPFGEDFKFQFNCVLCVSLTFIISIAIRYPASNGASHNPHHKPYCEINTNIISVVQMNKLAYNEDSPLPSSPIRFATIFPSMCLSVWLRLHPFPWVLSFLIEVKLFKRTGHSSCIFIIHTLRPCCPHLAMFFTHYRCSKYMLNGLLFCFVLFC